MTKNEFVEKREEYKKNAFAFIMENIAKCESDIILMYNDEVYSVKLGADNVARVYDRYDDCLANLSENRPLAFLDAVAVAISKKINND